MVGPVVWRGELVLVVGDLSVDVRATGLPAARLRPLGQGRDSTIYAETSLAVGGSAWQFARAVLAGSCTEPIVFAAVGDDPAGGLVREAFRWASLRLDGIARVPDAVTSVSALTYFEDRQRLMVFPARHANQQLPPDQVAAVLATLPPDVVTSVWLSGHTLLGGPCPRHAATVAICDWARRHQVPLVLDLVPHDFATAIGSLGDVEDRIGPVDGLVGELDTMEGLGYPPSATAAAAEAAGGRRFAVVQHRDGAGTYSQAVAVGGPARVSHYDIPAHGLQGMGDAMAVEALVGLGLLAAAPGGH